MQDITQQWHRERKTGQFGNFKNNRRTGLITTAVFVTLSKLINLSIYTMYTWQQEADPASDTSRCGI